MKIDRLLGIIMFMLYRRTTTVGELSRTFEVTERTIYRDLETLDLAGIPLDSSVGRGGGIGLIPGFRLEERLFSSMSLGLLSETLGALKELFQSKDLTEDAALASNLTANCDDRPLQIHLSPWLKGDQKENLLKISQAITDQKLLELTYTRADDQASTRKVEPLRLFLWGSSWYLQTWCLERQDYRIFRVSRIKTCLKTNTPFNRLTRLQQAPQVSFEEKERSLLAIDLQILNPVPSMLEHFGNPQVYKNAAGVSCFPIHWPLDAWVEIWLAGHAPEVTVVAPQELRERIKIRLTKALEAYSKD